jgi:hypothetical protein
MQTMYTKCIKISAEQVIEAVMIYTVSAFILVLSASNLVWVIDYSD